MHLRTACNFKRGNQLLLGQPPARLLGDHNRYRPSTMHAKFRIFTTTDDILLHKYEDQHWLGISDSPPSRSFSALHMLSRAIE